MTEGVRKIALYLRIVMPILFLFIGIYCLVFPEKIKLPPNYTKMFAFLVIGYGLFRGYRAYKELQAEKNNKE